MIFFFRTNLIKKKKWTKSENFNVNLNPWPLDSLSQFGQTYSKPCNNFSQSASGKNGKVNSSFASKNVVVVSSKENL